MKKQSRSSLRRSGRASRPGQPVRQQYSGAPSGEYQEPYDWRYGTQQPPPPYSPDGTAYQSDSAPTAPIPRARKRSRPGAVVAAAAAVAVGSGGLGAAVLANRSDPSAA